MLDDEATEPVRAHPGSGEVLVKLSATATIDVETDGTCPILTITDGPFTILVMPHSLSEGDPLQLCDVEVGSRLVLAAGRYRNALAEGYAAQQNLPLPQRRAARRLADHREAAKVA